MFHSRSPFFGGGGSFAALLDANPAKLTGLMRGKSSWRSNQILIPDQKIWRSHNFIRP